MSAVPTLIVPQSASAILAAGCGPHGARVHTNAKERTAEAALTPVIAMRAPGVRNWRDVRRRTTSAISDDRVETAEVAIVMQRFERHYPQFVPGADDSWHRAEEFWAILDPADAGGYN